MMIDSEPSDIMEGNSPTMLSDKLTKSSIYNDRSKEKNGSSSKVTRGGGRSTPPNLEEHTTKSMEGTPCMSFRHAALLILIDAKKPLQPGILAHRAIEKGYMVTKGKTPQNTIAAVLYTEMSKNPTTPFTKPEPGYFGLKSYDKLDVMNNYYHPPSSGQIRPWKPKKQPEPRASYSEPRLTKRKKERHSHDFYDDVPKKRVRSTFKKTNSHKSLDESHWFSEDSGFSSDDMELDQSFKPVAEKYYQIPKSFEGTNFVWAKRIELKELTQDLVEDYVVQKGLPLVVSKVTSHWADWKRNDWGFKWLKENFGKTKMLNGPRDIDRMEDIPNWNLEKYLEYLEIPDCEKKSRLYGKDVTAPPEWRSYLFDHLPPYLTWKHHGDLLGCPPLNMQAESVMIYIGHENTRTPAHKDIVGTIGHNLLVYSENGGENGQEKGGAVWYCMGRHDDQLVTKFWKSKHRSIDSDNYFMPIDELKKAPFQVHVIDQCEGDLVIVPPEGAHQVVNRGRSCKFAWNRLNISILENTVFKVLPLYRSLKKPEVYRTRLSCLYALKQLNSDLESFFSLNPLSAHTVSSFTSTSTSSSSPSYSFSSSCNFPISETKKKAKKYLKELPTLIKVIETTLARDYVPETDSFKIPIFTDPTPHKRWCNICNTDILNRSIHCRVSELTLSTIHHVSSKSIEDESSSSFDPPRPTQNRLRTSGISKNVQVLSLSPDEEEEELEIDVCFDCAYEGGVGRRFKKEFQFTVKQFQPYEYYYSILIDSYYYLKKLNILSKSLSLRSSQLVKIERQDDDLDNSSLDSNVMLKDHEKIPDDKDEIKKLIKKYVEQPKKSVAILALHVLGPPPICHHCHSKVESTSVYLSNNQKHKEEILPCTKCWRGYCHNCLMFEYKLDLDFIDKSNWICFYCLDQCICVICSSIPKAPLSKPGTVQLYSTQLYDTFTEIESKLLSKWADDGPQEIVAPQFVV